MNPRILELNPNPITETLPNPATIEELQTARDRVLTSAHIWFAACRAHEYTCSNCRKDLEKMSHDTKRRALENLENDLVEYGQKAGLL